MKLFGYQVEEVNSGALLGGSVKLDNLDGYNKRVYDRLDWWSFKDDRWHEITVNRLRLGTNGLLFNVQDWRYIRVDTFKLTVEGGHSSDGPWTVLETERE